MKYLVKRKVEGKYKWFFNPPKDAYLAGVVEPKTWNDGRSARYEAPRLLKKIELFRQGKAGVITLSKSQTLGQVISHFLEVETFTANFNKRRSQQHDKVFRELSEDFGSVKIEDIDTTKVSKFYHQWLGVKSHTQCGNMLTTLSKIFDYLILMGVVQINPVKFVVREKKNPTTSFEVCDKETLKVILDACFSTFKDSSLGVVILLTYDTAQNPSELVKLNWGNFNLDLSTVSIRGLTLPLGKNTVDVLRQQKEMWGFQSLIAPYIRSSDNALRIVDYQNKLKKLLRSLGITKSITFTSIKNLAIKELVELDVHPSELEEILNINPYQVKKYYDTFNLETVMRKRQT